MIKNCEIGKSTIIFPMVNLYDCKIGENCKIANFVEIGKNVIIGDNVNIQAFVFIPEGIEIKDNVFIGPGVIFCNDKYPPSEQLKKTIVYEDVSIGASSVILPGIKLYSFCKIGAGSVVTKNVLSWKTVIGNPARMID